MWKTSCLVNVVLENAAFPAKDHQYPHLMLNSLLFSFRSILSKDGVLYVKLRAGQLSYKEDPMGWQSLLAQTVANRNSEARAFKVAHLGGNGRARGEPHPQPAQSTDLAGASVVP